MITIFANSTFYTPMSDGETPSDKASCLDMIVEYYDVNGLWANGLTVLHVLPNMRLFTRERHRKNIVIINLGCVEAFTHPAPNILHWCSHFLLENGCTPQFQIYTVPMMVQASYDLAHGKEDYYNLVPLDSFYTMLKQILLLLEGFTVFLIGMNKPNQNNPKVANRWKEQAERYDQTIRNVVPLFNNVTFFDIWESLSPYVVDTTHLTPAGHLFLFDLLSKEIRKTHDLYGGQS